MRTVSLYRCHVHSDVKEITLLVGILQYTASLDRFFLQLVTKERKNDFLIYGNGAPQTWRFKVWLNIIL